MIKIKADSKVINLEFRSLNKMPHIIDRIIILPINQVVNHSSSIIIGDDMNSIHTGNII